jgi:hypothetical protein
MISLFKHMSDGRALPYAATAMVLLALLADRTLLRMAPAETDAYHASVRDAIATLPTVTGSWVGVDTPVPEAAVRMLHPNIILSRRYQNLSTNETVTLLIVHVRDARDVLGHYPPVCYPGQGWKTQQATPVDWNVANLTIRGTEYEFGRDRLEGASRLYVDNFLILAGGETCRDMDGVELAAQDRSRKFYGAGQVQLVHDGRTTPQRRREISEEFLQSTEPALRAIVGDGEKHEQQ